MLVILRLTDSENKLTATKGDRLGGRRDGLGFGTGMCTLRYMESLAKGNLLYSTANSTQYSVRIYMGKDSKWMCV